MLSFGKILCNSRRRLNFIQAKLQRFLKFIEYHVEELFGLPAQNCALKMRGVFDISLFKI